MTIIRIWDVETSGSADDGGVVVESGWCDLNLEKRTITHPKSELFGLPIGLAMPPEVRAIHHIGAHELPGEMFDAEEFSRQLGFDGVAAMAAHSAEYETSFMRPSCPVICTYKSALRAWPEAPSHSNGALFYWLQDQGKIPADVDMALCLPAHRAGPDAYVTAWILLALFNEGYTGKRMLAWTKEPRLLPRCPIGKFRGKPWAEVEAGFLGWMLKQPDMEADLKWNAQKEIDRRNA